MRRIIASHLVKHYRSRFYHYLLPFNFAVGVTGGMDFAIKATGVQIERYILQPQACGELPSRVAIFIDLKKHVQPRLAGETYVHHYRQVP